MSSKIVNASDSQPVLLKKGFILLKSYSQVQKNKTLYQP